MQLPVIFSSHADIRSSSWARVCAARNLSCKHSCFVLFTTRWKCVPCMSQRAARVLPAVRSKFAAFVQVIACEALLTAGSNWLSMQCLTVHVADAFRLCLYFGLGFLCKLMDRGRFIVHWNKQGTNKAFVLFTHVAHKLCDVAWRKWNASSVWANAERARRYCRYCYCSWFHGKQPAFLRGWLCSKRAKWVLAALVEVVCSFLRARFNLHECVER